MSFITKKRKKKSQNNDSIELQFRTMREAPSLGNILHVCKYYKLFCTTNHHFALRIAHFSHLYHLTLSLIYTITQIGVIANVSLSLSLSLSARFISEPAPLNKITSVTRIRSNPGSSFFYFNY